MTNKAITTLTKLQQDVLSAKRNIKKGKLLDGMFGFYACKKSIEWDIKNLHKDIKEIYTELVLRGLTEHLFNLTMIATCEIMIEELDNAD